MKTIRHILFVFSICLAHSAWTAEVQNIDAGTVFDNSAIYSPEGFTALRCIAENSAKATGIKPEKGVINTGVRTLLTIRGSAMSAPVGEVGSQIWLESQVPAGPVVSVETLDYNMNTGNRLKKSPFFAKSFPSCRRLNYSDGEYKGDPVGIQTLLPAEGRLEANDTYCLDWMDSKKGVVHLWRSYKVIPGPVEWRTPAFLDVVTVDLTNKKVTKQTFEDTYGAFSRLGQDSLAVIGKGQHTVVSQTFQCTADPVDERLPEVAKTAPMEDPTKVMECDATSRDFAPKDPNPSHAHLVVKKKEDGSMQVLSDAFGINATAEIQNTGRNKFAWKIDDSKQAAGVIFLKTEIGFGKSVADTITIDFNRRSVSRLTEKGYVFKDKLWEETWQCN